MHKNGAIFVSSDNLKQGYCSSIKSISEKSSSDSFLRNVSDAVSYFSNHSVTHASEKATVYVKIR